MFKTPKIFSTTINNEIVLIKAFNKNNALKYYQSLNKSLNKKDIIEIHTYNNETPIEFIHPELYQTHEIYF
jgi:hypothetical protein